MSNPYCRCRYKVTQDGYKCDWCEAATEISTLRAKLDTARGALECAVAWADNRVVGGLGWVQMSRDALKEIGK